MSDDNNEDPNPNTTSYGEKRKQNNEEEDEPEPLDLSTRSPLKRSRSHDVGQERDRSSRPDDQRARSADRIPLGTCSGGYTPTISGITPLPPRLPLPTNRPRQPSALTIQEIQEREIEAAKTLLELRDAFIQPRPPPTPYIEEMPPPSQSRKPMHVPRSPGYPPPPRPPPPPTPLPFVRMRPVRLEMPPLIPIPPAMRVRHFASTNAPPQPQPRFAEVKPSPTENQQAVLNPPSTSRGTSQEWPNITFNFPNNNQPILIDMTPPAPGTTPFPFGWPVVGVPLTHPIVQIQPQPVVSIGFFPQPQNIVPVLNISQQHVIVNNPQQPIFRHPPVIMTPIVQNRPLGSFMPQPMNILGHGNFEFPTGNRTFQQPTAEIWRPFQLPVPPPYSDSVLQTSATETTVSQAPFVQTSVVQTFVPIPNPLPGNSRSGEGMNVSPSRLVNLVRSRNTTTTTTYSYNERQPVTPRNQLLLTSPRSSPRQMIQPINTIPTPVRISETVSRGPRTPSSPGSVQSAIVELNEYVSRIMDTSRRRSSSPCAAANSPRRELFQRSDADSNMLTESTNQTRRTRNERVMRRPQTPRGTPFYSRCPFQVSLPMEDAPSTSSSITQNEPVVSLSNVNFPERAESPSLPRAQSTREVMGTPQQRFAQFVRPDRAKSTSQVSASTANQLICSSSWPPAISHAVTPRSVQPPNWPQCPTPLYHQYNSTTYLPNIPQSPRVGYNPPRAKYYVPKTAPKVAPKKQFEKSPVLEHSVQLRISEDPEDPNNWDIDVNKILEILQNVNFDTSDDEMDSENAN